MIRANQSALNHRTNQAVLNIRQSEINYYSNMNVAFGTQAALVGGFTYGVFLSDHTNGATDPFHEIMQGIYWVIAAGTMCSSVFIIMTTMFMHVFGPGLALNGPVGSMIKAAEGLREEQGPVMKAFVIMMILFSLSSLMLFWIVMNIYSAAASTIVYLISARYWYFYCERIYLRFYWNPKNIHKWYDDHQSIDLEQGEGSINPIQLVNEVISQKNHDSGRLSQHQSAGTIAMTEMKNNHSSLHDPKEVAQEGYLLRKGGYEENNDSSSSSSSKERWQRHYFVLFYNGNLFMYQNRQVYHTNPRHLEHRPIDLHDYMIVIDDPICASLVTRPTGTSSSIISAVYGPDSSNTEDGASSNNAKKLRNNSQIITPSFLITFKPLENQQYHPQEDRLPSFSTTVSNSNSLSTRIAQKHITKNIILRMDTEEELHFWLDAMKEIVPENIQI